MWVHEHRLIDCPLGQVSLTFSSQTSVRCVLKRFSHAGKRYYEFRAHFHYRASSGRWQANDYVLWEKKGGHDVNPFGGGPRKEIGETVRDALQGWWVGYGVEIKRVALTNELKDAERDVAHLKLELQEQQQKVKQAKAALAALPPPETPVAASDSALESLVSSVL